MTVAIVLQSTLTCPSCGAAKGETMPTNACQYFYECVSCKTLLKPKPGDCFFCSTARWRARPFSRGAARSAAPDRPHSCIEMKRDQQTGEEQIEQEHHRQQAA